MSALTADSARQILSRVMDPALEVDVVKHRIVTAVEVQGAEVLVSVDIPTHAYPQDKRRELTLRIETALKEAGAGGVTVMQRVVTAYQPPPSEKALLPGVKNIIAVAAGKGGVGKSTVATNLALALRAHGASVGVLDADVFGPSMPTMLGPAEAVPAASPDQKIVPALHHGLKVISVGFFTSKEEAVVWRGPMVHRLLQQFLGEVVWGDLDYLVVDLPPGTGDVQLSLSQLIPVTGAIMVTTPQEVSIVDVVRAIAMFNKVEIPVLGVVENMSFYRCPSCGHHDEIFSHGGGKRLAQEIGSEFLGEIPIDTRIRFGGDSGVPIVVSAPDSEHATRFLEMASKVALGIAGKVLAQPRRSSRLAVIR
jgi:ATP-binding protein involved in chromosome partitioning